MRGPLRTLQFAEGHEVVRVLRRDGLPCFCRGALYLELVPSPKAGGFIVLDYASQFHI